MTVPGHTPTLDKMKDNIQLALYAIAVRQQFPSLRKLKVRLVWHFMHVDHVIEPTEADLQGVQARAAALAGEIFDKFYKQTTSDDETEAEEAELEEEDEDNTTARAPSGATPMEVLA